MANKTVSVLYEESEGTPTIAVGGVLGAPSPDGAYVVAHLYSDFSTIPAREDLEVGADGAIDASKSSRITRGEITRKVLATIVMSPEIAKTFAGWLAGQANLAEQARARVQQAMQAQQKKGP